ncbi:hypothetical protein OHT20_19135 [Streptomyces caniferus]|uniref:Uncharacterized protein n=1 Tax=Streptomyces caniferus TaxID=285557 RepID=A0A640SKH9_9ACTN|nr:hypothetical protein [Streptomyces caniferus]GFE11242.1 hypothetical protein Scani_75100 [Streptomyces caniferus]
MRSLHLQHYSGTYRSAAMPGHDVHASRPERTCLLYADVGRGVTAVEAIGMRRIDSLVEFDAPQVLFSVDPQGLLIAQ